jgi:hypothetical protein
VGGESEWERERREERGREDRGREAAAAGCLAARERVCTVGLGFGGFGPLSGPAV